MHMFVVLCYAVVQGEQHFRPLHVCASYGVTIKLLE